MKGFWMKKLPAFLLAMAMTAGLASPAALAAPTSEHNYDYSQWLRDDTHHWHACSDADCEAVTDYEEHDFGALKVVTPATCYQRGSGIRTCQTCGQAKTVVIGATNNHVASDDWTYNTTSHWHSCTATAGCTAKLNLANHSYPSGVYVSDASNHWQICAICHGESAKSAHKDADSNGACDVCGKDMPITTVVVTFMNGSSLFSSQTISRGGTPSRPATPSKASSGGKTYSFLGWTTSNPGSSAIYNGQSYLSSSQVASTALSANTTYYALYDATGSRNHEISYKVNAGGYVMFNRSNFWDVFTDEYPDSTLRWVEFSTSDTLSTERGTVYYDRNGADERTFTRSTISDYRFYYNDSTYGDYALRDLCFAVPSGASARTVTLDFTAHYSDSKYASGTLTIKIGSSGSQNGSDITYSVSPGRSVDFDINDFRDAYQEEYSETPRWVEFSANSTLSTSKGTIYYDYDYSDEVAFTTSTISDYRFYFSSSTYGKYPLKDLSFVAPSGASARTVTLDYTVYYSDSKYVSGTLTIKIGSGGSSQNGSNITYSVTPGKSVAFDITDFRDAYQEEYNETPRWVKFYPESSLSTSAGTVYYNYGGSGAKSFTSSNIDDYKFYYSSSTYGDYALKNLSFVAPSGASARTVTIGYTVYYSDSKYVEGTLTVKIGSGGSSQNGSNITYSVSPGKSVAFDITDFRDAYQEEYNETPRWVTFSPESSLSTSTGTVYYNYGGSGAKSFTSSNIDDYKFYYSSSTYGNYALKNLSFVVPSGASARTVTIGYTVYYSDSKYVEGTLTVKIGNGGQTGSAITYSVTPGNSVNFDITDFRDAYQEEYNETPRWVTFSPESSLSTSTGTVYYNYGSSGAKSFTSSNIDDYKFYYSSGTYGDYALKNLSFVVPSGASSRTVTIGYAVYYSDSKYVEGTLTIKIGSGDTGLLKGDICYGTTYNTNVQINPNDIARFFARTYPGSTLQYVKLGGVPNTGVLYYNYYGASKYGAKKTALSAANCGSNALYYSPTSTSQYSLGELTYVPGKTNLCDTIPFTAYGTNSRTVTGTILISVTLSTVADVYGVTPKNTAVTLPAAAISSAIVSATGSTLGSIQLLSLPAASVGTVYVGSGTSVKANTSTLYGYSSGSQLISQLRFVPATGYTGSVEIPYAACNTSGTPIAYGKFCLGIVNAKKEFSDVTSSTWCYKYVTELSDASIISGYADGSFKPNNTVTYGAALKLIMLAAGYSEQKSTDSNVFSGYLAKARAEGIITRSNVDLTKPITRLQVAQIAAGALKLNTSNLSSAKPFTDTTDASVQALNAAGVVEGYFANGTSTYKPNNTLTRGQVSAIVWRMERLSK